MHLVEIPPNHLGNDFVGSFYFSTFPVCEKVLEAAALLVNTLDVPLEILLHFIATLPRAFTDYGGNYAMWIHGFSCSSIIYFCFLLA